MDSQDPNLTPQERLTALHKEQHREYMVQRTIASTLALMAILLLCIVLRHYYIMDEQEYQVLQLRAY